MHGKEVRNTFENSQGTNHNFQISWIHEWSKILEITETVLKSKIVSTEICLKLRFKKGI